MAKRTRGKKAAGSSKLPPRRATARAPDKSGLHSAPGSGVVAPSPGVGRSLTHGVTRNGDVEWLTVVGARQNNLKNISAEIPLGRFVSVTGVSGSGKSSLVNDIVRETLTRDLNGAVKVHPGLHDRIEGLEHLDKVIDINQAPIGRTPRSNPATYIKVFDQIRILFAMLPDSKVRGYKPGRFSFNVHTGKAGGGRCEACEGNGSNKMEMELLADVWITCPICTGRRFSRETLQILYKGRSIADVLEMDVQEALTHFEHVPKIAAMLRTLHDVGLDYMKLGQSSTTLSGGEAQRIKLSRELVKKSTGRTLYILDEPTTGLHFHDIKKLLAVLHGFVDGGNSVIVIEHNLDVIKTADWVIDLGPEGGERGGRIVAAGTPEDVARSKRSHTGASMREVLGRKTSKRPNVRTSKRRGRPVRGSKKGVDSENAITVVGARQHNLKDITVSVPRGAMTVCAGPSGSGKSSFAIDTVYTEGQRRYVESLSAYARQFLGQLQPPRVDHVYGLSPAICIEQKNTSRSPRSTVGTVTEIYDYMRVLWARIGEHFCPACKIPVGAQTSDEIVERVLELGDGVKVLLLAPIEPTGQETYGRLFRRQRANGYRRVRINGVVRELDDSIRIDARRRHRVELVVDRIVVRRSQASRITDSVEQALSLGSGVMIAQTVEANVETSKRRKIETAAGGDLDGPEQLAGGFEHRFSQFRSCHQCGRSYEELTPHHFSFNSRLGWCEACEGLGVQQGASPAAIVIHPTRSIADGAVAGWGELRSGSKLQALASSLADHIGFELHTPWNKLAESQRQTFLQGCGADWIEASPDRSGTIPVAQPPSVGERQIHPRGRGCHSDLVGMRFQWHGFFPAINRATRSSWKFRKKLEDLVTDVPCEACGGARLRPEAAVVQVGGATPPQVVDVAPPPSGVDRSTRAPQPRAVGLQVGGATLHDVCTRPLGSALSWFEGIKLSAREREIAGELLHEIISRLRFLTEVGLDYITLHRTASTLSGGEAQRIQLASQIGTGLTGVLYVLDEPTIGLHPRDNGRLIRALHRLRDLGNTMLVVEHDREVIDAADHVLDFGPGAGSFGGEITAAASPRQIRRTPSSLTGQYLSLKKAIPVPSNRRPMPSAPPRADVELVPEEAGRGNPAGPGAPLRWLTVHGARENNLAEIDVSLPLGRFTCVTGVSGSGKSTLVSAVLYNALAARIHRARTVAGGHERITGVEHIDKVINVDQTPIGNSPTSNPATYTNTFDLIRELFAQLPLSKIRGYTTNRFSFNRPGGRCEVCTGMGRRCIEMHFLPDVWVECESCKGTRYVSETLDARYHGRSIAEVLRMRVSEALELFENVPKVKRMLQTLYDVGLGYVELGQAAPTLSGGEAQRVKLAAELGRPSTGKTLYILDEPTTGLHFDDLAKLLTVLHRLVDLGNTCICIEHNLDVIKTADWIIDLGPEAGEEGGQIVAEGTPEAVARTQSSHTGVALRPVLEAGPVAERDCYTQKAARDQEKVLTAPIKLGEEVEMPWERDGRSWHTVNHLDSQGRPVAWDAQLLIWFVETIESLGTFASTDWANRTRVEITAGKNKQWFAHFLTGGRDLLDISLRVPEGTFNTRALAARLKIKTLDERTDLPIYGQWNRTRVRAVTKGWAAVRLTLRDFKDVAKRPFRAFLKEAVAAYFERLDTVEADATLGKPWKTDGRQWHLSQGGMGTRHVAQWKPTLLMAMIGRFKALGRHLQVSWNQQTAVQLSLPDEDHVVGKIVTNIGRGLRIELRAPRGVFTPAQIDRLGEDPEIKQRGQSDYVIFWARSLAQIDTKQLADVWRLCRAASADGRLQSA